MTRGQRIRTKREELNISQTDLAKKVKISKQTLYKYENDIITNIPSDKIEEIAEALNVSPAYIYGWNTPTYDTSEAMQLYQHYMEAAPNIQAAVRALLGSDVQDP